MGKSHPHYLKIRVGKNSKLGSQTPLFFILAPKSRGVIAKVSFSCLNVMSTSDHPKTLFRIAPDRSPGCFEQLRSSTESQL